MITLNPSPVVFDEATHRYTLGERRLSGITSLIHDVLRLGVYPDASDFVRNVAIPRAAEYGTSVHHAIQNYDTLGLRVTMHPKSERFRTSLEDRFWDVSDELDSYISNQQGYQPVANEYTVSDNERYASQIDNVWLDEKTQGIWLVDTKTNNIDLYPGGVPALQEYLSWQLSVYAYLFERQNPGLKVAGLACNWLRRKDSHFWKIERKDDKAVADLLAVPWVMIEGRIVYDIYEAEQVHVTPEAVVPAPETALVAADVVNAICDLVHQQKEAEAKVAELKARLRQAMENAGVKSWDSGKFKATIGADSTSTTFDTRRFKADHPELYKQYTKQTPKKGGFTITLREE